MSVNAPGRFVWHELITTQFDVNTAFYKQLFGWSDKPMEVEGMPPYRTMHLTEDGKPITGIGVGQEGVPSHWLPYLTVANVDEAAEQAKQMGGEVLAPPFDIPNIGRAAIVKDNQGAVLALFKGPEESEPSSDTPELHTVCWTEMLADDVDKAVEFYSKLVGWSTQPMGDDGTKIVVQGERMAGTIRPKPAGNTQTPNCWMTYFLVDDVEASSAKVKELGGNVMMGKMDIPNMGSFSVVSDPSFGVFSLWKEAPKPAE